MKNLNVFYSKELELNALYDSAAILKSLCSGPSRPPSSIANRLDCRSTSIRMSSAAQWSADTASGWMRSSVLWLASAALTALSNADRDEHKFVVF